MNLYRMNRVKEQLMREISNIILTDIKDPRVGIVTITDCQVSPDLRNAKVFISTLGDNDDGVKLAEILNSASNFFKNEIRKRIRIKYIPNISFVYDPSFERGNNVLKIIEGLKGET